MTEVFLSDLIEKTREAVKTFGLKRSALQHYERNWRKLSNYFEDHGCKVFSEHLADQYLSELEQRLNSGKISGSTYRLARRAVYLVKDCFVDGCLVWKRKKKRTQLIKKTTFIWLHTKYICHLQNEQKSEGTVGTYGRTVEQFLEYLELKGCNDISEVTLQDVSEFFPYISNRYPKGLHVVLPVIRSFLRFLETEKLVSTRLVWAVPQNYRRENPIVSIVTKREVQILLKNIDRDDPVGKRDYAVLLLAVRTGLRSADISNLRLCDIKWESNTIELTQKKTGCPLMLPLLTDVGNSIVDYILNARPKSASPYVFLRHCAPFQKISSNACYGISCKAMKKSEIHQNEGERKGLHCLRHTLATHLLEKEVPLPIISTILGHKSKASTKVYLSADLKNLKCCALDLTGIEVTKEELL